MADRQAAFVRQVGEPNPDGEILIEQLDGAPFLQRSQSRRGHSRGFLQPGIPLQEMRTKEQLQIVHAQRTRRAFAPDARKKAFRQLRQHEILLTADT